MQKTPSMNDQLRQKDIRTLLTDHCVFAIIFHLYGINVFDHFEKTLEELCIEKELDMKILEKTFLNLSVSSKKKVLNLDSLPMEVVLDFVNKHHKAIVERKLPFLISLVEKLKPRNRYLMEIKEMFPTFVNDIKNHIAYEEQQMLPHIVFLMNGALQNNEIFQVYSILENKSMDRYIAEHKKDERDELFIILDLAQNAHNAFPHDVQIKILMHELKSFNDLLKTHATIENEILLPKAQALESEITDELQKVAILN